MKKVYSQPCGIALFLLSRSKGGSFVSAVAFQKSQIFEARLKLETVIREREIILMLRRGG